MNTLIDAMPDLVIFKDGEGRYLEANDYNRRFFQLEHVDCRGKTDAELAEFTPFYHLVVVGRDITERKRAEEALRASEAELRADPAFASIPVAAVVAFVRAMSMADVKHRSDLTLLDIGLPHEDGYQVLAEVSADIKENLPLLTGDRQRINQIMLNLISNACKFTQEGRITIGAHRCDGEIVLYVKDTGPDIAPDEHAAVFETFRQTVTGLHHGKGTGLGMPISKKLAEAHSGHLWLESEQGKEATFYVALPLKPKDLGPVKVH